MEVILVKPVRKLGQIGQLLKVKNGFGRNYLLPQKLAIRATAINKQLIEQQKHDLVEKDTTLKIAAESINSLIINTELIFIRQSAADGRLFGSVTNKEIAERLSEASTQQISQSHIVLVKQIKSTGVFSVEIRLHAELSTNIIVIVARSESEAQDYILKHNKENAPEAEESTVEEEAFNEIVN